MISFILTQLTSNALVQQLVPKDRLLVVRLENGLGWEEICPFLGHKMPSIPYPRGNNPQDFVKMMQVWLLKGTLPTLATAAALAALVIALCWYSYAGLIRDATGIKVFRVSWRLMGHISH